MGRQTDRDRDRTRERETGNGKRERGKTCTTPVFGFAQRQPEEPRLTCGTERRREIHTNKQTEDTRDGDYEGAAQRHKGGCLWWGSKIKLRGSEKNRQASDVHGVEECRSE